MQAEIDRLNAIIVREQKENARIRESLAKLEERLHAGAAPMNRSTGMRCPVCCAKVGEPHLPSCPKNGPQAKPIIAKHAKRDDFTQSTVIGYVQFLAWSIWHEHYKEVSPDFEILADACGVLSQIDNMTCAWKAPAVSPAKPDLSGLMAALQARIDHHEAKLADDNDIHCACSSMIINELRALLATWPVAQAKPDDALIQIEGGPPIPVWYAKAIYQGWRSRAGINQTFEQFVEKYPSFLTWESMGSLYCDKRTSNACNPKSIIDFALASQVKPDK